MGRYRNVSILGAAIFLQIVGLAVQVKRSNENRSSRLIRVWAVSAITPFEKAIVSIQSGASDIWHNYFYLRGVRQENRQLKDQIEQLQLEQVRLQQDANQAHRLQVLLGFKEQFIAKTLAAQVIGSSGSEQSRTVYIDKGSRDGVQQDMAVISADGVVGRVITVYKSTSQVLLINDQQSGVGSIFERSRVLGVTQGKASGGLVIDKVMADEDVKPGDKVLTSGGDLIFPKGLLIGTVAKLEKGSEFLQITVKPAAALNRLEEVLVIIKKEEREPASTGVPVRAADILAQRLPSVPDKPAAPANASSPGKATGGTTVQHDSVAGNSPANRLVAPGSGGSKPSASTPAGSNAAATPPKTPAAQNLKSLNPAISPSGSGSAPTAASKPGLTTVPQSAPDPKIPQTSKPVTDTSQVQPNASGDTPQ